MNNPQGTTPQTPNGISWIIDLEIRANASNKAIPFCYSGAELLLEALTEYRNKLHNEMVADLAEWPRSAEFTPDKIARELTTGGIAQSLEHIRILNQFIDRIATNATEKLNELDRINSEQST